MANALWKDMSIKIAGSANATTGLVDFSPYTNSQQLADAITVLETTGMGTTSRTRVNGLFDATITISGFLNSTTENVLGKVLHGTSMNKMIEFKVSATPVKIYRGYFKPSNVQFSGEPDTLEVFSASFVNSSGLITRTSVAKG